MSAQSVYNHCYILIPYIIMTIYKVFNKYRVLTQTVDIVSSYIVLINMIKK